MKRIRSQNNLNKNKAMTTNIDKGIRCTNFIADLIIIYFIWYFIYIFTQSIFIYYPGFHIITVCYYFILEATLGQTIGKMITKTKIIKVNGQKPSIYNLIIRSICRIVPFDTFSFLFGYERGFHDIMSSTKLYSYQ